MDATRHAKPLAQHLADGRTARRARQLVAMDPQLRMCLSTLQIHHHRGVLYVDGCLPTYYAKQQLQTLLMELDDVQQLVNRVCVRRETFRRLPK